MGNAIIAAEWPIKLEEEGITLLARVHENGLSAEVVLLDNQDEEEFNARWIVKWDGCMHWESNPEVMGHTCDFADWERVYRAGRLAYVLGVEAMGDRVCDYVTKSLPDWRI